jgi:hypothetical protein
MGIFLVSFWYLTGECRQSLCAAGRSRATAKQDGLVCYTIGTNLQTDLTSLNKRCSFLPVILVQSINLGLVLEPLVPHTPKNSLTINTWIGTRIHHQNSSYNMFMMNRISCFCKQTHLNRTHFMSPSASTYTMYSRDTSISFSDRSVDKKKVGLIVATTT